MQQRLRQLQSICLITQGQCRREAEELSYPASGGTCSVGGWWGPDHDLLQVAPDWPQAVTPQVPLCYPQLQLQEVSPLHFRGPRI